MENNKDSSMSERDRKMSESFEVFDDSDDKKEKKKKKDKKIPKKSLFLTDRKSEAEKMPEKLSTAQEWVERQKAKLDKKDGFLPGLVAKESNRSDSGEQQPSKKGEAATGELEDVSVKENFGERIDEKIEKVHADITGSASEKEEAELIADERFLNKIKAYVAEGLGPEEALDTALHETVEEELDVTETVIDKTLFDTTTDTAPEDKESESSQSEATRRNNTSTVQTTPTVSAASSPVSSSGYQGASSTGMSSVAPGQFVGPKGIGSNFNLRPVAPNVVSADTLSADPNTAKMNEFYYRRKNTGKVILAGLLGYAVGRRGGRKRTEARLQPEIDTSNQKLNDLEQKLEQSEQVVRTKAAENVSLQERLSQAVTQSEKTESAQEAAPTNQSTPLGAGEAAQTEKPALSRAETTAQEVRELQAEREKFAQQLVAEKSSIISPSDVITKETSESTAAEADRHENIVLQGSGKKVVETSPVGDRAETDELASEIGHPKESGNTATFNTNNEPAPRKQPEQFIDTRTMTMPEILQRAEKIDVGTGSLKDMYKQGKIDAVNLRKVVAEHAAGRKYDQLLSRSLEAEEMKHELRNEVKTASTMAQDAPSLDFSASGGGFTSDDGGATSKVTTASVQPKDSPPDIVEMSLLQQTKNMSQQQPNEPTQEYLRVSTPTAIALGVLTGGVFAAVLMLFIF